MTDPTQPAPAPGIDFEAIFREAKSCKDSNSPVGRFARALLALRDQLAERDAGIARMREKERLIDKFVDGFPVEVDF